MNIIFGRFAFETWNNRNRNFLGSLFHSYYAVGSIVGAYVAYKCRRRWRPLLLSLSIFSLTLPLMSFVLFESPRWLLVNKGEEEALGTLRAIAKVNKCEDGIQAGTRLQKVKDNKNRKNRVGLLGLLKRRRTGVTLISQIVGWFYSGFSYYGLCLAAQNLAGNIYLNSALLSAVEIPGKTALNWTLNSRMIPLNKHTHIIWKSYTIIWKSYTINDIHRFPLLIAYFFGAFFLGNVPRRLSLSLGFLLMAMLSILMLLLPAKWVIVPALISKALASLVFLLVYMVSSEVFPTEVRQECLGLCNTSAGLGDVIAPALMEISAERPSLFPLASTSLAILAALAVLPLPETLNTPLMETLDDDEHQPGRVPDDPSTDIEKPQTSEAAEEVTGDDDASVRSTVELIKIN